MAPARPLRRGPPSRTDDARARRTIPYDARHLVRHPLPIAPLAALLAACHGTPAAHPLALPAVPVVAPAPTVAPADDARPTFVASASQPTVLLPLGDALITTDMARRAFLRVPLRGGGEPAEIPGAGHYPTRLLADGPDAWIESCVGDDRVMHVTAAGMHTPLVSQQPVYAIARDATHVYFLSGNAPNLRRVPRVDARGEALSPDRAGDHVEPVVHVAEARDLAAVDGDVYLATLHAVVHVRPGAAPRRLATLPSAPSTILADGRDVFVGTDDGAVLHVARDGGALTELGRIDGRVAALHVDGCFVYAGGAHEVTAFERARGVRVDVARAVTAMAVTTVGDRVFFTDYTRAAILSRPMPACPVASARGDARVVTARDDSPAAPPAVDDDPLAGRSPGDTHTVEVRFDSTADPVAREAAARLVTRVVASRGSSLWARATDPQILSLREHGFDAALRDGVDRLRCADARREPARVHRAPPSPWHAAPWRRVFVVQLGATSSALDDLQDALAAAGATLLDSDEPATLRVEATAAAARGLRARIPGVTLVTPYGPFERLALMADVVAHDAPRGPCDPTPDARLRALAAWIAAAPDDPTALSVVLFRASPAVEAMVRAHGGAVRAGHGDTVLTVQVPRRTLAALGDADDVRTLEPYAEATVDAAQ